LQQQFHSWKCVIFQERLLKFLKCYNFLWVQRQHNCSPVASFANCVMTLYLLRLHLQTFLPIPITKKCQILSSDTLVANEKKCVSSFSKNTNQNIFHSRKHLTSGTWNACQFECGVCNVTLINEEIMCDDSYILSWILAFPWPTI
jgi:hypothetical protein